MRLTTEDTEDTESMTPKTNAFIQLLESFEEILAALEQVTQERDKAKEDCAILQRWAGRGIIFAAENGKLEDVKSIVEVCEK